MFKTFLSTLAGSFTPTRLVTGLVAVVTAVTMAAQFDYARNPTSQFSYLPQHQYFALSLWKLDQRVTELGKIPDPVDRELRCLPLAAQARHLDQRLDPRAEIFMDGVLGKNPGPTISTYFFLRNYLYPRNVEISLDARAVPTVFGFDGVSPESREEVRANGFDAVIWFNTDDTMVVSPLTPRGKLK